MTSLDIIEVILLVMLLAVPVNFWLSKISNVYRDGIIIGAFDGVPISLEHRYHILWSDWLPLKSSLGMLSGFLALGYVRIADFATDDRVRLLAYLGAVLYGLGFVFYLFLGGSDLFFCLRTLRKSKRS
ncbi:MAG: hypothetical protein HKN10_18165 [Myxococcales bacterium]|nr:hypothetical protein [Myxococcales bacterium]